MVEQRAASMAVKMVAWKVLHLAERKVGQMAAYWVCLLVACSDVKKAAWRVERLVYHLVASMV